MSNFVSFELAGDTRIKRFSREAAVKEGSFEPEMAVNSSYDRQTP
jgi:hypothetical protein